MRPSRLRPALGLLVLLASTPALAETLPYAAPQVGTVSTYLMDGNRTYIEEITAVEGDRVELDGAVWLFRSVLPVGKGGLVLDESALAALWPLTPGESLSLPATWDGEPGTVTMTVGPFEQISVAAGWFETLRVTVEAAGEETVTYSIWLDRTNHLPVLMELQPPGGGPAFRTALAERQLP